MDRTLERTRPGLGPTLLPTKRARARTRVILVPLLAAATVLVPAVAAQAKPAGKVQATAGRQLSVLAGLRPSLARQRHAGDPLALDRRLSGPARGPAAGATAAARPFGSFGSALVGSAPVPPGPNGVAVDRATDTIYVATGNNADGPTAPGGDTVSVIDGRHCQASDVSRCQGPWPTVKVGNFPGAVTVDQVTDTVYVTNFGDNTVSVIDGATCNSLVSSGCGQTTATVPVGAVPAGIFADHANHTVYVTNAGDNTVSMIDSATCTGSHLAGCPSQPPPTVAVGGGPGDVDVNEVTHSVYVTILTGLSVFAENTCNATDQSGCGDVGQAVAPGIGTAACEHRPVVRRVLGEGGPGQQHHLRSRWHDDGHGVRRADLPGQRSGGLRHADAGNRDGGPAGRGRHRGRNLGGRRRPAAHCVCRQPERRRRLGDRR